ncbi:hypothetical protein FC81_GL001500 [Liquorilactobacillus capillatus DSM 19910]|uniref:DUF3862 domain-containing protein n=2 Tax=Liquorilactobacillus capillatus TaxID=480931 RepID=A0A0R1MAU8_9LACO|nr:hypothetical protein FC81_GL001500 [Liquorilactobacillus capillatus DSM 19910]
MTIKAEILGGIKMSKKIIGEDGKTYKVKKPFYKRIWFWVLVVLVISVGSQMGNSKSDSAKNTSNNSSKTASSKSNSAKKSVTGLTEGNFNKITLSENNGTTVADVQKLFGKKADSTSEQTIQNIKSEMHAFNNVDGGSLGSNIIVGFSNNHAISKAITGIKVDRVKKVSLSEFNNVSNGTTKDKIQASFGKPNGISLTNIGDQTTEIWTYTSGVKGSLGSNFEITFTNDAVSGKTQTNMQ